jgi:hypothetical protein
MVLVIPVTVGSLAAVSRFVQAQEEQTQSVGIDAGRTEQTPDASPTVHPDAAPVRGDVSEAEATSAAADAVSSAQGDADVLPDSKRAPVLAQATPAPDAQPHPTSVQPRGQDHEPSDIVAKPKYSPGQAPHRHFGHFGLATDFGISAVLPDAGLWLVARPVRWGEVQLGGGYNGLAFGLKGGISLVNPFVIPLSVTGEAGHYFEGDANSVVQWFKSDAKYNASLSRFSYDYMNLLGGLSVGQGDFAFYIRGGVTWMRTTVRDFQQSVRDATKSDLTVSDPVIHYRGPALKIGIHYFL